MRRWGLLAAPVALALLALACGGDSRPEFPYPVQTFDDLGREHLSSGQTYDFYNSDPPTTGPHAPQPVAWGVQDEAPPKEMPVHNMEHGGVVIWYNCSGGEGPLDEGQCQDLHGQLAGVTESAMAQGKLVLMVPYPDMDYRIALTAWRVLFTLDQFDGERVQAFIESYERRFNPEGL